jgi:hypothetical protein
VSEAQEEKGVEDDSNFFEALSSYFAREPQALIWFTHTIVESLDEAIRKDDTLPHDLKFFLGAIKAVDNVFWNRDRRKVILSTIADSNALMNMLAVVTQLAKAYVKIKDGNTEDPTKIRAYLVNASEMLTELLKAVIDNAEMRTCDDDPDDDSS